MNERDLSDIKKKLGIEDHEPTSDVALAIKEMTKQAELMCKVMLQMQMNQNGFVEAQSSRFERLLALSARSAMMAENQLLAILTPQAAKLAATLGRAGAAGGTPARPTGEAQVSPDDDGGAGFLEDEHEHREPVDMVTELGNTNRFSGAGFRPPG